MLPLNGPVVRLCFISLCLLLGGWAAANEAENVDEQAPHTIGQMPSSSGQTLLSSDQILPTHGMRPPPPLPVPRMPPPPPGRAPPPKRRRIPSFLVPSSELDDTFDGAETAFVYVLPSRSRQCFHHRSARPFQIEFRVLHGGRLDLDAYVVGPDGRIAYESRERRQGRYAVVVPPPRASADGGATAGNGTAGPDPPLYTICLDNRYSSWYAKVVDFSIQLPMRRRRGDADDAAAASASATAGGPLPEELTAELARLDLSWAQFLDLTDAVEGNLHHSVSLQRQFRSDETRDRMAMEDSASCVSRWSLLQLAVIISVSALQVLMIRALFDERSMFHRVWKSRGTFIVRS